MVFYGRCCDHFAIFCISQETQDSQRQTKTWPTTKAKGRSHSFAHCHFWSHKRRGWGPMNQSRCLFSTVASTCEHLQLGFHHPSLTANSPPQPATTQRPSIWCRLGQPEHFNFQVSLKQVVISCKSELSKANDRLVDLITSYKSALAWLPLASGMARFSFYTCALQIHQPLPEAWKCWSHSHKPGPRSSSYQSSSWNHVHFICRMNNHRILWDDILRSYHVCQESQLRHMPSNDIESP